MRQRTVSNSMKRISRLLSAGVICGALFAGGALFDFPSRDVAAAPSALYECACVDYVRAAWKVWDGLPEPGHAYMMAENNWFQNQGFHRITKPEQWAAVILEKGWGGLDANSGHAALVEKAVPVNGGYKLTMRGANQRYSDYWKDGKQVFWEEYDCNNVSDATLKSIVTWDDIDKKRVTFWMPNTPRW